MICPADISPVSFRGPALAFLLSVGKRVERGSNLDGASPWITLHECFTLNGAGGPAPPRSTPALPIPLVKSTNGSGYDTKYEYNGLHQKVLRDDSPTLVDTYYFYGSDGQLLQENERESDGSVGDLIYWYVRGTQYVDDIVVRVDDAGTEKYQVLDARNNVVTVLESSGAVDCRVLFDAYGTPTQISPDWSTVETITEDNHLFQGRQFLIDHAYYDFRARVLDPEVGMFLQRDPIGLWGDAANFGNAYAFLGNDPGNGFDPTGQRGGKNDLWATSRINALVRQEVERRGGTLVPLVQILSGKSQPGSSLAMWNDSAQPRPRISTSDFEFRGGWLLKEIDYCQNKEWLGHGWIEADRKIWSIFKGWGFWGNGRSCGSSRVGVTQGSMRGDGRHGELTEADPYSRRGVRYGTKDKTCRSVAVDRRCGKKLGWYSDSDYSATLRGFARCLTATISQVNTREWRPWYNCRTAARDLLKRCCGFVRGGARSTPAK